MNPAGASAAQPAPTEDGAFPLMAMMAGPEQPENALFPMELTPLPTLTDVRLPQPANADAPMLLTLSGMATEVRPYSPRSA